MFGPIAFPPRQVFQLLLRAVSTVSYNLFHIVAFRDAGDWGNFWLIKAGYSGVQLVNQSRLSCTLMGTLPPLLTVNRVKIIINSIEAMDPTWLTVHWLTNLQAS